MKPYSLICWAPAVVGAVVVCIAAPLAQAETPAHRKAPLELEGLEAFPDGHYRVALQVRGQEQRLNFEAKGERVQCVASSDPQLKDLAGRWEAMGNGVFLVRLRGEKRTASQFWIFRKDGSAAVKEIPDRGEKQTAVPAEDASLAPESK